MCFVGLSAHLILVLCDLMLECRTLLLQMMSCGFEPSLSLSQPVHMWVGRDLRVRHSPMPIGRMWGSPILPMRGIIVSACVTSLGGRLSVSVIDNLRHDVFA
jgi:hypothetical protein